MRPPPFVEAMSIANVSVKCGTSWKRNRIEPISSTLSGSNSSISNAFSIRSSLPHAPTTRRKQLGRTAGRVQLGPRRLVGARPAVDRRRLLARRVGERVGERNEVEEVVRVQVRDHDRVDLRVVAEAAQLREHAVAAIEQDRGAVLFEQVPAAGTVRVLPGRRLPSTVSRIRFLTSSGF